MASGREEGQGPSAAAKRRRLPGVNLRPGSVKQARAEAGLSLAQLGKGHVTAPAIYLIETGRTRPSLPTLEHIARRTGRPVEFFLADATSAGDQTQSSLLTLGAMVADGRIDQAIVLGQWLLEQGASAQRLGRIRYLLAQAYLGSQQPDKAEPLLAEARAHFKAVNDRVMLAECIGAQAALANLMERKDGLGLAEEALEVCRSINPIPKPIEARLLGVAAAAHAARHESDAAIASYEAAIEAAGPLLDLPRMARAYSVLGVAYQERGESEAAAAYLSRSTALFEILRDRTAVARSENNLALALMERGELTAARAHLELALAMLADAELGFGRSHVLLSLCQLCFQEDGFDEAKDFARQALEQADRLEDAATAAEAHVWLGRIADRQGEHEVSDLEFEHAIEAFKTLGMRERLLQTHGVYAEVLERRGELAKAYGHMKQALQASRPAPIPRDEEEERLSTA